MKYSLNHMVTEIPSLHGRRHTRAFASRHLHWFCRLAAFALQVSGVLGEVACTIFQRALEKKHCIYYLVGIHSQIGQELLNCMPVWV